MSLGAASVQRHAGRSLQYHVVRTDEEGTSCAYRARLAIPKPRNAVTMREEPWTLNCQAMQKMAVFTICASQKEPLAY
jgi:hypothetical protein